MLCPKNLLFAHRALSIMKYLWPQTPPHPKLVEASMNYSFFPRGSFPKIKSKDSPEFFVKIIRHTTSALYIAYVILINFFPADGVIFPDNTDRKGLPKGATHAAYVKLPTNFSKSLTLRWGERMASLIRRMYFSFFFSDNRHNFLMESYMKPRISITRAGGQHFFRFILAPVSSPTAISCLNNTFALNLSDSTPAWDLFGPPKKSLTYEAKIISDSNFSQNLCENASHQAVVYRQNIFEELAFPNGILRSM